MALVFHTWARVCGVLRYMPSPQSMGNSQSCHEKGVLYRAGYEFTVSVSQAQAAGTKFRWVHGGVQLGDSLTKWNSRRVFLQFYDKDSVGG